MRNTPIFEDRFDAGRRLAERVVLRVQDANALVLALPRGGVPVGFEVARKLHAELDIFLVRKLGLPQQQELAIGAIASGGIRVLNEMLLRELRLSRSLVDQITARETREMLRQEELYREGRRPMPIRERTVILVDDGLATGASMKAAVEAVRRSQPKRIIVAVPVAAEETCDEFRTLVDEAICAHVPAPFMAVGAWYVDFSPTPHEEVQRLLRLNAGGVSNAGARP